MYKIYQTDHATVISLTMPDGNVSWIPLDPANNDYQQFLEWIAEANTPEPYAL